MAKARVWSLCLMFLSHLRFFVTFLGAIRFNKAGLSLRNVVVNCPCQVLLLFFPWTKHHKKCTNVVKVLALSVWLMCSFLYLTYTCVPFHSVNLNSRDIQKCLGAFIFFSLQQQIWPCTRQSTKVPVGQFQDLTWSCQHQKQWMDTEIQWVLSAVLRLPGKIRYLGLWWIWGKITQLEEWILQMGVSFMVSRIVNNILAQQFLSSAEFWRRKYWQLPLNCFLQVTCVMFLWELEMCFINPLSLHSVGSCVKGQKAACQVEKHQQLTVRHQCQADLYLWTWWGNWPFFGTY